MRRPSIALIVLTLLATSSAERHISVLWLGNSYIADNRAGIHLDQATASFINTAHDSGLTDMVVDTFAHNALWAMGLAAHFYDSTSMALVASGRFTHVVMQGYILTRDTIEMHSSAASNIEFGAYMADEIRKAGAVPIVYGAHPRCDATPYMWQYTIDAYKRTADSARAQFAPVSIAWKRSRDLYPDIGLYQGDCIHQNANGIYLNAAMFYCVLTGSSVVGNPVRNVGPTLEADTVALLQQTASAVYDSVARANPQAVVPSMRPSRTGTAPHSLIVLTGRGPQTADGLSAGGSLYTLTGSRIAAGRRLGHRSTPAVLLRSPLVQGAATAGK